MPLQLLDVSLETLDTFIGEDADPQKIMEILSFRFRPPTLANGDGEPLVLCSVEFELPQADRHRHSRRGSGRPLGPPDERDGTGAVGPGILAAVTPIGTLLSVEANGTWRFDEVIALVRASGSADSSSGPWCNGNRVTVH